MMLPFAYFSVIQAGLTNKSSQSLRTLPHWSQYRPCNSARPHPMSRNSLTFAFYVTAWFETLDYCLMAALQTLHTFGKCWPLFDNITVWLNCKAQCIRAGFLVKHLHWETVTVKSHSVGLYDAQHESRWRAFVMIHISIKACSTL